MYKNYLGDYKYKRTKKLIKRLRPYWKTMEQLQQKCDKAIENLEKKMAKEIGIPGIEFFRYDNMITGIGNRDKTMQLVHDGDLENE